MLNRLKSDKANLSLAALAVVTIVLVVVGLVWDRHRQSNGTELSLIHI